MFFFLFTKNEEIRICPRPETMSYTRLQALLRSEGHKDVTGSKGTLIKQFWSTEPSMLHTHSYNSCVFLKRNYRVLVRVSVCVYGCVLLQDNSKRN